MDPRVSQLPDVLPLLYEHDLETVEGVLADRLYRRLRRQWGPALTPADARRWTVEPEGW